MKMCCRRSEGCRRSETGANVAANSVFVFSLIEMATSLAHLVCNQFLNTKKYAFFSFLLFCLFPVAILRLRNESREGECFCE